MPSLVTSVGLRLESDALGQSIYLDASVARRSNNTAIGLVSTTTTGWFLHKTDAGRRGITWTMSTADFSLNLGGAQGTVTLAYLYSDTSYDLTNPAHVTLLNTLVSAPVALATFQAVAPQVGRYRYLKFILTSASGAQDPTVTESGATQTITASVEFADLVTLSTLNTSVDRTVHITRKTTPTLAFTYVASPDGMTRYDISGGTALAWIAKSYRAVEADGAALVGPLAMTINDGPQGELSITLTQAQTTLESGEYMMQIELTKGGVILRHAIHLHVAQSFL